MSAVRRASRVPRWAAAGAIAMSVVAIADAGWAAFYGDPLPRRAAGVAMALEVAALIVPGLAAGALLGLLVRPIVRLIVALGPKISASVVALGVAGAVAFVLLRDREIDWDTVDVRLLFVPLGLIVLAAALKLGTHARWIIVGGLALAAVTTWVANPSAQLAAIDRLSSSSRVGEFLLMQLGRVSDSDGDGASTRLCGDVCDCDDGDASISPIADEIPGDGIDQDCDGEDISATEEAAIESMFAQPSDTPTPTPEAELRGPKPKWRPDILIITIDTLRADHLGVYGYPRDTSPNIDAWAKKDAVVFAQARSGGPSTRFSIPSMMVGRHFTELSRNHNEWPTIHNAELFFAERLAELGYASAAFHSVRYFRPYFGIGQGWEHWSCACLDVRGPPLNMTCADFIVDETLTWLDEHGKTEERPLLLWSYIGDPHSRYVHHEGTPEFGGQYKDTYDHEIRFVDEHVGRLLAEVKSKRPDRDLVIILHADHGEGLDADLDHGSLYHSANLFDELVHVPLIVSGPGFVVRTEQESVSLVDFVPTMLELMGEPIDPRLRGTSLVPWLYDRATAPHPPVMFEKHRALDDAMHGMVAWPYKVIKTMPSGRIDIFDLAADPGERHDITGKLDKALRKKLTGALSYWHREIREPFDDSRRH
ncbi:MAG TPA: sulfatase [Nannocystaceae bacterium]|nr:sulfatase [Nannocystaceae bacterium]